MAKHERAAAFGGSDGQAYSVAIYVEDEPDVRGTLRRRRSCSSAGLRAATAPIGHVETDVLAWGRSPAEAASALGALSLYDVKAALDDAIARAPGEW